MRFSFSLLLPLSSLLVAGCGYTPLYAPTSGTASLPLRLGTIEMASVKTEPGQRRVAQEVRERLAQSYPDIANEGAVVHLAITETTSTLALQSTAAIERAQINLSGALRVEDAEGKVILATALNSNAAYNVETNPFSTESGKIYARQVAARNLADAVGRQLALFQKTSKQALKASN